MKEECPISTQGTSYFNQAYDNSKDDNVANEESKRESTLGVRKVLTKEETRIKWSILKNVLCLSFSFTLLFTSYNSLSNLQSSLYQKLGTTALGVIYVALVVSSSFLPTLVIKKLNPKWGVCLCMFLYAPYFATLYFPRYYTFIPAALLLGFAGAPLWASKCTYISKISEKYAEVVGESFDVVVVRFFGIFFCFLQSSQVWGNLISSAVLSAGVNNFTRSEEFLDTCGANFCPGFELGSEVMNSELPTFPNETISVPTTEENAHLFKIYLMTSIYLFLALVAAIFVAFFVDPLSSYGINVSSTPTKTVSNLLATVRQMKNPYQILITPLTIWSGVEQGFLSADYTSAFVSCGLGVHSVGLVLICFGVSDAIFSFAFTPLVRYLKRVPIFTFGALLNLAMVVLMFTWRPHPSDYFVFFLVPTLWGMADAVWQTQINAFYGVIFPGEAEAAFSNYRLWESLGFLLAYVISGQLCTEAKLGINLTFLAVGMTGYYVIEILEARRQKKSSSD